MYKHIYTALCCLILLYSTLKSAQPGLLENQINIAIQDFIRKKSLYLVMSNKRPIYSLAFNENQVLAVATEEMKDKKNNHYGYEIISEDGKKKVVTPVILIVDTKNLKAVKSSSIMAQKVLRGHKRRVMSMVFRPAYSNFLITGSQDKTVKEWNIQTGKQVSSLDLKGPKDKRPSRVNTLAANNRTGNIAAGGARPYVYILDIKTVAGKSGLSIIKTLRGHSDQITSLSYSSLGNWLVSASKDTSIKLWDPVTGALKKSLLGQKRRPMKIPRNPKNDPKIAAEIARMRKARAEMRVDQPMEAVMFNPAENDIFISGGWSGHVDKWNVAGEYLGSLKGDLNRVFTVGYNKKGNVIAAGAKFKEEPPPKPPRPTLVVWIEVMGRRFKIPLMGHTGSVTSLVFDPKSGKLASGSVPESSKLDPDKPARKGAEVIIWDIPAIEAEIRRLLSKLPKSKK